jgi:hypothetical protein
VIPPLEPRRRPRPGGRRAGQARLAELGDGAGKPLGGLAFLGDGDLLTQALIPALRLLAGESELFAGAVVAALRLLGACSSCSRPIRTCRRVTAAPIPAPLRTSRAAKPSTPLPRLRSEPVAPTGQFGLRAGDGYPPRHG